MHCIMTVFQQQHIVSDTLLFIMESMLRAYLVVANDFDFQFHSIVFFAWRDTFYEVFQVQGSCIQFILVFAKGQWPINTIQNSHTKADVYVSMRCGGHHNHCHSWVYRGMFFRGVPSLFFMNNYISNFHKILPE